MASSSSYTTYPPTTPTTPWQSAIGPAMNQHRSNLSGKRKALAFDTDDIDPQFNSNNSNSISTQFKKLRLNNNRNHNNFNPSHQSSDSISNGTTTFHHDIPASPSSTTTITPPHSPTRRIHRHHNSNSISLTNTSPRSNPHSPLYTKPPPSPSTPTPLNPGYNYMPVDETPHRIIIHDLDAEIAQIEAEELAQSQTVFLPDIDKKVSSIPQRLLQNRSPDQPHFSPPQALAPPHQYPYQNHPSTTAVPTPVEPTALILYKDPTSISVPEEEDVVRKTIIEARKRAREKAVEDQRERDLGRERFLTEYRSRGHDGDVDFDDAMTDQSSVVDDGDGDGDAMELE